MSTDHPRTTTPQGFQPDAPERLPLPARDKLTSVQRMAADAMIAGPRKSIHGPFVPLLRCPELMQRLGATADELRFRAGLPAIVREYVILLVARETGNQCEWQTHVPLAKQAGCAQSTIDAIA